MCCLRDSSDTDHSTLISSSECRWKQSKYFAHFICWLWPRVSWSGWAYIFTAESETFSVKFSYQWYLSEPQWSALNMPIRPYTILKVASGWANIGDSVLCGIQSRRMTCYWVCLWTKNNGDCICSAYNKPAEYPHSSCWLWNLYHCKLNIDLRLELLWFVCRWAVE